MIPALIALALALPLLAQSPHEREMADEIRLLKLQNEGLRERLANQQPSIAKAKVLKAETDGAVKVIQEGRQARDAIQATVEKTSDSVDDGVATVKAIKRIVTEESQKQEGRARRQIYFSTVFAILLGGGLGMMVSGMRKNYSDVAKIARLSLARVDSATNEALQQKELYHRLKQSDYQTKDGE